MNISTYLSIYLLFDLSGDLFAACVASVALRGTEGFPS